MKITLLSTSDLNGGAAKAAFRLLQALRRYGLDSNMLVQEKRSDKHYVSGPTSMLEKGMFIVRHTLDQIPFRLYKARSSVVFTPAWWPSNTLNRLSLEKPDITHMHLLSGGFFRIESLAKVNIPVVWTLHDMWPFTGGCHYAGKCEKYMNECGKCPQLNSNKANDLSHRVWQRKQKSWGNVNLTVVTPSKWLATCARRSSLFKNCAIEVIPYNIDLERYSPVDKMYARKLLGLPIDKKLILFGSMSATSDPRKGFSYLQKTLLLLYNNGDLAEIVIFGSSKPEITPNWSFKTHYMGILHDDISISLLYGACDVFVAPSTEDNLPLTVMEALSCGTPCIAFNVGGMPDMIEHKSNGYLVKPFDSVEFAKGIDWVLENEKRQQDLSKAARSFAVNNFSSDLIVGKYIQVFNKALQRN